MIAPVPDTGVGPAPVPGEPVELMPGLLRLTAPNPGLMTGPGTNSYVFWPTGWVVTPRRRMHCAPWAKGRSKTS
jgi:hypothetical protein